MCFVGQCGRTGRLLSIVGNALHGLWVNGDFGAILNVVPQLIHVLVAKGDATVGPVVLGQVVIHGLVGLGLGVAGAMQHHIATSADTPRLGLGGVLLVGVGNVQRFVKLAVGVAPIQYISAFWGFAIAFGGLVAYGVKAQTHGIGFDGGAVLQYLYLAASLVHPHLIYLHLLPINGLSRGFLGL